MSYSLMIFVQVSMKCYILIGLVPSRLLEEKKYFSFKTLIATFLLTLLYYNFQYENFIFFTVFIVMINFVFIKNLYKKGNLISLITSVVAFTLLFISIKITQMIFVKFFSVDLLYFIYDPMRVLAMAVVTFIISFLFCMISRTHFFNEIKDYSFERKNMNIIGVYIILSIVFLALIGNNIEKEVIFSPDYFIGIILFITFILVSLVYLFQIKELIRSKNDYHTIYDYIANVEKVAGQLKKQEHEHNNQLIAIKSFAQENNTSEIVVFIDKVLKNKIKNKISANIGLDKVQDSILKNLLMHKINAAAGFGVKIEAFIRKEIQPLNIAPKEIANVIGIIMDNAIQGAVSSEQKYLSILLD